MMTSQLHATRGAQILCQVLKGLRGEGMLRHSVLKSFCTGTIIACLRNNLFVSHLSRVLSRFQNGKHATFEYALIYHD